MVDVVVEFAYEAEQDDELSLKIGDIVKNVVQSDGGWWEGELSGKKGMFPENFVKVIKPDDKSKSSGLAKKEAPQRKSVRELASKFKDNVHLGPPPARKKEKKKKCKVVFEYTPEHEDELQLKEGEIVDFIREVEDGWYEGSINGKSGVFPSNFVEMCEEPEETGPPELPDKPGSLGSGDETSGNVHEIKGKKVIGIGLGNIFQGGPIKLRSASRKDNPPAEPKKPPDMKEPAKPPPPEPTKQPPPEPAKPPPSEPARPPPVDHTEVVKREKKGSRAVVRFSYAAEQPDELSLKEGETITVLDQNLEDEGWWKGEVNGKIGVFPDNFVELIPEETPKPKKPPPPSIATIPKGPAAVGKTGLYPKLPDKVPAADPHITDAKKHDTKHDGKHKIDATSNKNKEPAAPAQGYHQKPKNTPNDRMVPPTTAAKKPFVPPPVGKKPPPPKPDPPKPTEPVKVEPKPVVTAASTKDVKSRENRELVDSEDKENHAGESEQDFESLEPTSQKLIHLTASRAKGPKKRPPSTIFNQGDLERGESQESDDVSTPPSAAPTLHNDKHPPLLHKDSKQPSIPEIEKKPVGHLSEHSNHHHHHHNAAPPRPPEPTPSVAHHGAGVSSKVIEEMQKDLRELRGNTVSRTMFAELRADYERLKQEMETFRTSSTKKIRELMMEVDEEKKLRLNTQVEIERIKKLLAETNV